LQLHTWSTDTEELVEWGMHAEDWQVSVKCKQQRAHVMWLCVHAWRFTAGQNAEEGRSVRHSLAVGRCFSLSLSLVLDQIAEQNKSRVEQAKVREATGRQ
jgi:hypothetical protein